MFKNWILPLVSLLSAALSIARFKATNSEIWAVLLWISVALMVFGHFLSKWIRTWATPTVRRLRRVLRIAAQVEPLLRSEHDIERLGSWLLRHAPARTATKEEVTRVVCEAPVLAAIDEKQRATMLDTFREEVSKSSLILFRWHERLGLEFDFDFDSFRFLNPDSSSASLGVLKHHINHNIHERFLNKRFDTLVFVLREEGNHFLGNYFNDLRSILNFEQLIGMPIPGDKRWKDSLFVDLIKACNGKSVLLVDPYLVDRGLDQVYEKITKELGGSVEGVVVMFEVRQINPTILLHHVELQNKSGQKELRGQVILDLKKTS